MPEFIAKHLQIDTIDCFSALDESRTHENSSIDSRARRRRAAGDRRGSARRGGRLACDDLADQGYSLAAYLAAYAPETWGRVRPTGPLEDARVRSVARQTLQTQINVGPNTTIIGLPGAELAELTLMMDTADNVIVRNLTFTDSHDCFPAWSPTDAENNYLVLGEGVDAAEVIHDWGGTALTERGTWVRQGSSFARPTSLLTAYNADHDVDLGADAGWTPTLRAGPVLPAPAAGWLVPILAGARL